MVTYRELSDVMKRKRKADGKVIFVRVGTCTGLEMNTCKEAYNWQKLKTT